MLSALCLALALHTLPMSRVDPGPVPAPQEPQPKAERIPGTRVTLVAPGGHEPGKGFLGYQWVEEATSLIVMEVPGAYSEVVKGMTADGLARGGMKLLDASDAKIAGRDGKLVHATQEQQGVVFEKWLALCGEGRRTLMLNAAFPEVLAEKFSAPLKAALLGAEWDPKLELDPFAVLPWTIATPEGLRFAGNLGTNLIYTEDGEFVQKEKPESARLFVGPSMGKVDAAGDPQKLAETRARQIPEIGKTLEFESSKALDVADRKGWEIVAKARDAKNALDITVYLVMLVGEGEYMLFTGQCAHDRRDTWLPRWRACARSWKPKPAPGPESKR